MAVQRGSAILGAGLAAILLGSCAPQPEPTARQDQVSGPSRHAVRGQQLRSVMSRMGTEVRKAWPQEIASEREAQAQQRDAMRFEDAADLAKALAEAANGIPGALEAGQLSGQDLKAFMDDVDALRARSADLRSAAQRRDKPGMRKAMADVRDTCMDCHRQFREVAGPLKFGW